MSGIEATDVIGILAIFLGGIVLGVVLIVSAAIKREDRRFSLNGAAPDFLTRGARILIRVGIRGQRIWARLPMDAALVVAAIVGVFFVVGLVVGGVVVIALPWLRDRRSRRDKRRRQALSSAPGGRPVSSAPAGRP